MNIFTSHRFKSFYWRTGMMVVAVVIASFVDNIDMIEPYVNPAVIGVLGLALGEVSKGITNWLKENSTL